MKKILEKSGRTEEDAIQAALQELGLERDDISVEILERSRSGFLGIGAVHAVVRVTYDAQDEPETPPSPAVKKIQTEPEQRKAAPTKKPADIQRAKPKFPENNKPAAEKSPTGERSIAADERRATGEDTERVKDFLTGLLQRMEVSAELGITNLPDGSINVDIAGPGMGAIIGRRGETLDAIQHLTNYVVNRGSEKHVHISVDAENYRAKREESLVHLAEKMAAKVLKYKRSMALEPMNSYERHVIHTALQDYEGVSTGSTGTEPNRRVVISCDRASGASGAPRRSPDRREPRAPRQTPAPGESPARGTDDEPAPAQVSAPAEGESTANKKPQSREWS